MFRVRPDSSEKFYRLAVFGLSALSVLAFAITVWVMVDFSREQEIVRELKKLLPKDAAGSAEELAGELRWQFRLTALVVLNLVVTFFALILLWRAYRSSQQSLRDVRALAGDILSSVDQAIITTDVHGTITSINQRGIQMLALNNEFVGRPLSDLNDSIGLDAFRRDTRASTSNAVTRDFSFSMNGSVRTLRSQCQQLTDWQQADIGDVLQLRDVTQRQLIEARMRRMERFMGLGALAAGLHHEIKNPLAAVVLHVQLLEEHLDDTNMDNDTRDMVSVIKVELNRIGRVLEGFRSFASLEQLEFTTVNVGQLVQHQVALIQPRAESIGVQLQVDVPDTLPTISADHARLEQVLVNLFVNALEAMPDGGTLRIIGEKFQTDASDAIRLSISDTGNGIPQDLMDDIFDPYFSTKSHGTGMGLAYCDKIIRLHNGSIDLKSSETGTVCDITLLLDRQEAET